MTRNRDPETTRTSGPAGALQAVRLSPFLAPAVAFPSHMIHARNRNSYGETTSIGQAKIVRQGVHGSTPLASRRDYGPRRVAGSNR